MSHPSPGSASGPSSNPAVRGQLVRVPQGADLRRIWSLARVIELVGGRIVDPEGPLHGGPGLRIVEGRLAEPREPADRQPELVVDVRGGWMVPGLADLHVHLREPGHEEAETIASGLRAAAAGGFCRVACMPDTDPPIDQRAVVDLVLARAREAGGARLYPVAALTLGLRGKSLTEMAEMRGAGVLAVTNDHVPVASHRILRRAMEYARTFDLLVISSPDDESLRGDGVMNEGYWSTVLGLEGIPAAAEEIALERDIALCRLTGARMHVAHVSTERSVELVRRAKDEGLPVTADTAPHYFTLTDRVLQDYDASFKTNPPLRSERDVEAILRGLADGTLDAIASDHTPCSPETKEVEIDQAPFGVIGLETSLGLSVTHLVRPGRIGAEDLVRLMSQRPARIMGWDGGELRPGRPAELTVIDTQTTWTVDPSDFASRSRNTPFAGWELQGRAALTVVDGRLLHARGLSAEVAPELLARAR